MYMYFGGVPTPMRVKYSPLPWESPETTELLNPPPGRGTRLPFLAAAREVRSFTLTASRWSLRLKSCTGVLPKDKESMWCNWRVVVEESGSVSVMSGTRESESAHERVCWVLGRGLRTRFWYWSGAEEEAERKMRMVRRKRAAFLGGGSIGERALRKGRGWGRL
jgi:hypothetical protein